MKPTTTIFAGVPAFCWMLCLGMGWHGCWCRRTSGAVAHSLRRPLLFHSPRRQSRASCYTTSKRRDLASATAAATTTTDNCDRSQHRRPSVDRVCVVGGGLAGLSVTYHLLQKTLTPLNITIVDRVETVGTGGASAVAGG